MDEKANAVWRTIEALNDAWIRGNVDALDNYFAEEMVAITPMDRDRLDGKAACIASWRRFVDNATIHEWQTRDPKVQIYGNMAIATYYYDLACDIDGKRHDLKGRDMFVLVERDGRWLAVADQFSEVPI